MKGVTMNNFIHESKISENSKLENCIVINSTIEGECSLKKCAIINSHIINGNVVNSKITSSTIDGGLVKNSIINDTKIINFNEINNSNVNNSDINNVTYIDYSSIEGEFNILHDIVELTDCTFNKSVTIKCGNKLNIFKKLILRGTSYIQGGYILDTTFKCDSNIIDSNIEDCYFENEPKSFFRHRVIENEIVDYEI